MAPKISFSEWGKTAPPVDPSDILPMPEPKKDKPVKHAALKGAALTGADKKAPPGRAADSAQPEKPDKADLLNMSLDKVLEVTTKLKKPPLKPAAGPKITAKRPSGAALRLAAKRGDVVRDPVSLHPRSPPDRRECGVAAHLQRPEHTAAPRISPRAVGGSGGNSSLPPHMLMVGAPPPGFVPIGVLGRGMGTRSRGRGRGYGPGPGPSIGGRGRGPGPRNGSGRGAGPGPRLSQMWEGNGRDDDDGGYNYVPASRGRDVWPADRMRSDRYDDAPSRSRDSYRRSRSASPAGSDRSASSGGRRRRNNGYGGASPKADRRSTRRDSRSRGRKARSPRKAGRRRSPSRSRSPSRDHARAKAAGARGRDKEAPAPVRDRARDHDREPRAAAAVARERERSRSPLPRSYERSPSPVGLYKAYVPPPVYASTPPTYAPSSPAYAREDSYYRGSLVDEYPQSYVAQRNFGAHRLAEPAGMQYGQVHGHAQQRQQQQQLLPPPAVADVEPSQPPVSQAQAPQELVVQHHQIDQLVAMGALSASEGKGLHLGNSTLMQDAVQRLQVGLMVLRDLEAAHGAQQPPHNSLAAQQQMQAMQTAFHEAQQGHAPVMRQQVQGGYGGQAAGYAAGGQPQQIRQAQQMGMGGMAWGPAY